MDDIMRREHFRIMKNAMGEEYIHGLPHVLRVYDNFCLFRAGEPAISPEVFYALESAVLLHDIGRPLASREEDHAAKSAKLIESLFQGSLAAVRNQDWILRAVANHSIGLVESKGDESDSVLALLCVLDHMDSLGPIGILRHTLYFCGKQPHHIPWIPDLTGFSEKEIFKNRIKDFLAHPEKITREHVFMRMKSLIEGLTCQYGGTSHIIKPVEGFLDSGIKKEIEGRLSLMKDYILGLCETLL
jgi:HD superfamily phosphodiesterase